MKKTLTPEQDLAKRCLAVLREAAALCENDGPVHQALEDCRYTLEDIADPSED